MTEHDRLSHVATLCGQCNCGCPEVLTDAEAESEQRVVITDAFGRRIQMSTDQFQDLIV